MFRNLTLIAGFTILTLSLAQPLLAEEYSLLSLKRLSVAAQAGLEYRQLSTGLTGVAPLTVVKIVPAYALFGRPGKSGGSVAITLPYRATIEENSQKDFGIFLSVVLWSGAD